MKRTKSQQGRTNRTRGHSFERKVASLLRDNGFPEARRHLEFQIEEANGVDISAQPFAIQCKATNKVPNIPAVFKEIKSTDIPTVFLNITGKGCYVVFPMGFAMELMRAFVYENPRKSNKGKGVHVSGSRTVRQSKSDAQSKEPSNDFLGVGEEENKEGAS